MFDEVFSIFFGLQGGSHGRIEQNIKYINFYALLIKQTV